MPLERCLVDYFPKTNLPEWGLHPLNSIRRRFLRQKCSFPRRKRRKWVIPHSFVNGCARRCLICIFVIFRFSKFSSPDEGLEPATLRLKVWCSTDWANRAWLFCPNDKNHGVELKVQYQNRASKNSASFLRETNYRLLTKKCLSPDEGLEPATLRLKVWCSTDWANRACVSRR